MARLGNGMTSPRIVVIGAGVGGVSFGIALRRRFPGFENFTIYEKEHDVGGTWRDNTYPGCSSDIPIHFFSASTDPYPDWDYTHGFQPQIEAYWQSLCIKYDLYSHMEFNTLVISAEWDSAIQAYEVVTKNLKTGKEEKSIAQVVVSALGVLEITRIPEFDGIERFRGRMFHSGAWDHTVDSKLSGKRVGVVGNGASATQFVPVISEDPTVKVVEFCRTPNWFLPPIRTPYSDFEKALFRYVPLWMKLHRLRFYLTTEIFYALIFGSPFLRWLYTKVARMYIEQNAPKEYVEQLVPRYTMGCKRVIFDTNWLASLHKPNMKITFDGVGSIYEEGIITKKEKRCLLTCLSLQRVSLLTSILFTSVEQGKLSANTMIVPVDPKPTSALPFLHSPTFSSFPVPILLLGTLPLSILRKYKSSILCSFSSQS
ncbi:hypothetical protein VKT23_020045 [Stygiomarasmius scandens]|uniref:Flavin-containing monooxygenase n=1 Tax=Marasmiellus scandens TaxID=2682957 RepID=A0ABR1IJY3_9AGAR